MKIQVAKRLSFKLARGTVWLALIVGILLNLLQVAFDYFSARNAMDDDIRALMEISHSPASQIAYNIDTRLAEELLQGLLRHPAIIDAQIVDPDGKLLARRTRTAPESNYRWLSEWLFGASQTYRDELRVVHLGNTRLGQLDVVVDLHYYGIAFLGRAASTLVSGFIKTLILSVMLLILFYLLITKPLLRVVGGLATVDSEAPEKARLPVPRGHDQDEIGLLVKITNKHLHTIEESLHKLRGAETHLKNHSERLEQTVAERTQEISEKNEALQRGNRALIVAKEEALQRSRSRADFLASMSHEIRTPLNGVLGMLNLALEEELNNTQRNRLKIAESAGRNLMELLNDMLDISKIEAGKLTLEHIPFSLRQVTEETAGLLAQQARRKGIDLITDIDPLLPEVFRGDPTRIRQVLTNLLGNAIKFTDMGQVTIQVHYRDDRAIISVSDTGIGISSESIERIFAPFAQAGADTTRRFGGTGLGLTLCRRLVEWMNGQIQVKSDEHQGANFQVLLPLSAMAPANCDLPLEDQAPCPELYVLADATHPHLQSLTAQLAVWKLKVMQKNPLECLAQSAKTSDLSWLPSLSSANSLPALLLVDPYLLETAEVATALRPHCNKMLLLGEASNRLPADLKACPVIELPLAREQLQQTLMQAITGKQPETPAQVTLDGGGLRVLLVEDNRVNQIVASGMLRKLDYHVDLAENGERALVALRNADYDLVLMDCQMPVMDGFEATRRIRTELRREHLPIIAVTANAMQGDRERCLAAGMSDYMSKPFNLEQLREIIQRWTRPDMP